MICDLLYLQPNGSEQSGMASPCATSASEQAAIYCLNLMTASYETQYTTCASNCERLSDATEWSTDTVKLKVMDSEKMTLQWTGKEILASAWMGKTPAATDVTVVLGLLGTSHHCQHDHHAVINSSEISTDPISAT